MGYLRILQGIDTHTECDPTRIIISGIPPLKGDTIKEKRAYFKEKYDYLRKFVMYEPRGHKDMFGAILTTSSKENCLFGMIFIDTDGYLDLCGHGIIAGVSTGIKTGFIPPDLARGPVYVDTPAGAVMATPNFRGNRLESVTVEGIKSFCYKMDYLITLSDGKEVTVDIGYGGNYFAFIESKEIGVEVNKQNISSLVKYGVEIKNILNKEMQLLAPDGSQTKLDLVEIIDKTDNPEANWKNVLIFGDGQVGRDPCATGLFAKMAIENAKGNLKINENYAHEGILGTVFKGYISKVIKNKKTEIVPILSGRTFIVGFQQFVLEDEDPLSHWLL